MMIVMTVKVMTMMMMMMMIQNDIKLRSDGGRTKIIMEKTCRMKVMMMMMALMKMMMTMMMALMMKMMIVTMAAQTCKFGCMIRVPIQAKKSMTSED